MHFLNNVKIIGGAQNHHFVNSFLQNLFFTALTVWRYNKLDLMGDSLYSGSLPAKSWRLIQDGEGVHIYERCVVYGSDYMPFLTKITRWPISYGTSENAEQAHLRLILEMDRILSLQM